MFVGPLFALEEVRPAEIHPIHAPMNWLQRASTAPLKGAGYGGRQYECLHDKSLARGEVCVTNGRPERRGTILQQNANVQECQRQSGERTVDDDQSGSQV